MFIILVYFGPAIAYQLIDFFTLSSSNLPKEEKLQLIAIRFATIMLCYLFLFFMENMWTYENILYTLNKPSLILLALIFIAGIKYTKPSKPKYIRILLHILSGILLFVICYNFLAIVMSV